MEPFPIINKKLKFVFLPEDLDPEDFINKYGIKEFENIKPDIRKYNNG